MPRPRKCRRVCGLPELNAFGPLGCRHARQDDCVVMTVDEYESIRLIDIEGLTQEECAASMDIARATAQRIYDEARKKVADCLVNAKRLRIEGGDYTLCDGQGHQCHGRGRHRCGEHGCRGPGAEIKKQSQS